MRTSRAYQNEPNHASLTPVAGGLAFTSSYDRALVAAFKAAIPADCRKWDPDNKRWLISPQYGQACADLARQYLRVDITVPVQSHMAIDETRLIKVEYLGGCRDRGNGEASAFGWADGGWTVIIPEPVLRDWFQAIPARPDEAPTLYAVLAVKPAATPTEIRSAYRRLALQWHPDVAKGEPDAAEIFRAINHAHQVLSNEVMRRKYDVGLALQTSVQHQESDLDLFNRLGRQYGYRAPLRCGWILCDGQESLGRFVISKILAFEDVVDDEGRTMIVSWPAGAKTFDMIWR